jgi:hypothetical protein
VLVFDRLQDFGFPYDDAFNDDDAAKDAAFTALCNAASANGNAAMQYIGGTGKSTLTATNSYPPLHTQYRTDRLDWSIQYNNDEPPGLNTSTARGFREIAKVIHGVARGQLPPRSAPGSSSSSTAATTRTRARAPVRRMAITTASTPSSPTR